MDKVDRVIFMWKNEVSDQKEKASDMRRRNEALVYNILPMHVAEHFMGNRKRSHDELYSQSYAEVGVLVSYDLWRFTIDGLWTVKSKRGEQLSDISLLHLLILSTVCQHAKLFRLLFRGEC